MQGLKAIPETEGNVMTGRAGRLEVALMLEGHAVQA
jgi:hypothetical protein